MTKELRKAIIDFMFDNETEFQLVNKTMREFEQYIYKPNGEHCIGGNEVGKFIVDFCKLIKP